MEKLEQGGSKPQGSENSLVMGQRRWGGVLYQGFPVEGGCHCPCPPSPSTRATTQALLSRTHPPLLLGQDGGKGAEGRSQGVCPAAGGLGWGQPTQATSPDSSSPTCSPPARLQLPEGSKGVLGGGEGAFLISFSSISAVP